MKSVEEGLKQLRESVPELISGESSFRNSPAVQIKPEGIVEASRNLRNGPGKFNLLIALTAVDYWPERPRFKVVYEFLSTDHPDLLRFEVVVEEGQELDSIVEVYPNADWHEREVFDMFGIRFHGHPDLRRILMPHDWVGHPLRRDYPLGYEEVQFSFNVDEINERKRYAGE